jgi:hypothetical protein
LGKPYSTINIYPFSAVPLLGKIYPLLVRQVLGNFRVG